MILPDAPDKYDAGWFRRLLSTLNLADQQNRKIRTDLEFGPDERLIGRSAETSARMKLIYHDDGSVTCEAL